MGLRIPPGGAPTIITPADGVAFTRDEIARAIGDPFAAIILSERFFGGDILFLHADNTFAADRTFNCPASDMISRDVWGAVLLAAPHEVMPDVLTRMATTPELTNADDADDADDLRQEEPHGG